MLVRETHAAEETHALGCELGRQARSGQIYCLDGDLGVGKTVFTQGFAEGLGITDIVSSPTFTIVHQYEGGRLPLYHFDVYRIGDIEEMDEIGYEDCFYGEGVCLIEWSELIAGIIPEHAVRVRLEKDPQKGFSYRRITVSGPKNDIVETE
ncbi:MAG: tRNA (adenosine(37)-N6)-threonylcarbamoyltransferase complex ATPase subunit type 1 TsaE [Clostridiales bacterium]|nr:tRNA (adenosine(37)-N6)-threonylcarbamoyltransferase complex ATPase subunit type 1 TsaE [Clostridiales bacterium]